MKTITEKQRQKLSDAFDLVKSDKGWKYPINKRLAKNVATPDTLALIQEAVIFFAGCEAYCITRKNGDVTVKAAGYYMSEGF